MEQRLFRQLYWEDVEVGTEVSPIRKIVTTQMLVKWAGASGDFNPIHYEDTFAKRSGQKRAIVHGQLKRAWLVQMMVNWAGGDPARLKKLSCRFRGVDLPCLMKSMTEPEEEETWFCKGRVTKKYEEIDEHLVDCEIWVENSDGGKTTSGSAKVILPSRSSKKLLSKEV